MASVRWTVGAEAELQATVDYLSRISPIYADTFHQRVIHSVDLLETYPRLGRAVPEATAENLRELIVGAHRIVYLVDDDAVLVLGMVHGTRDILRFLRGVDPWDMR
jgi:plasmid stabilization system protein ParE